MRPFDLQYDTPESYAQHLQQEQTRLLGAIHGLLTGAVVTLVLIALGIWIPALALLG